MIQFECTVVELQYLSNILWLLFIDGDKISRLISISPTAEERQQVSLHLVPFFFSSPHHFFIVPLPQTCFLFLSLHFPSLRLSFCSTVPFDIFIINFFFWDLVFLVLPIFYIAFLSFLFPSHFLSFLLICCTLSRFPLPAFIICYLPLHRFSVFMVTQSHYVWLIVSSFPWPPFQILICVLIFCNWWTNLTKRSAAKRLFVFFLAALA